jgi:hypothetical protein
MLFRQAVQGGAGGKNGAAIGALLTWSRDSLNQTGLPTIFFCRYSGYPTRGADPLAFVIAKNLKRRHLDESQRAMVAAKLATMRQGARTDLASIGAKSKAGAGALLNVGTKSVERAKKVREKGSKALIKAVEDGKIAVSVAAKLAGPGDPAGPE